MPHARYRQIFVLRLPVVHLPAPPRFAAEFVNSEITLWTASFVLLTLLINAPTLAPLVRLLRLDHAARRRRGARARAKRSLARFTAAALEGLQQQEKELLAGEL